MTMVIEPAPRPQPGAAPVADDLFIDDLVMDDLLIDELVMDDHLLDDLIDDEPISDDELAALALAADPDAPLPPDSVPWGSDGTGLLPDWYMPGAVAHRRGGWRAVVALAVVIGLMAINAAGLCITYGHLVIA